MEWIAWGYAIFVLAMIYIDWRMAGDIKQFELMREHDTKLVAGGRKPDTGQLEKPLMARDQLHSPR